MAFSIDQLKEVTDKLPPEHSEREILHSVHAQAEAFLRENEASEAQFSGFPACLHSSEMMNEHMREEMGVAETSGMKSGLDREIISQFEPGVYVTYVLHKSGSKLFKRVRFRYMIYFLRHILYLLFTFN